MRVGVIEFGGDLTETFIKEISAKIQGLYFERRKALDLFDVLAFARKMAGLDQLVIIAELNSEEAGKNNAFYDGLAFLEAETGKNIFKCIYSEDEDGETAVKELVEKIVNYLYYPEKKEEKKEEGLF